MIIPSTKTIHLCFLAASLLLVVPEAMAQQNSIKIKDIKTKKTNLNFDANGSVFKYLQLEDNTAVPVDMPIEQVFSLTNNYANLNFRWKNPLKYKFTWKDSAYTDEQQAAMRDFFNQLTPLFNLPARSIDEGKGLNKAKELALTENAAKEPQNQIQNPIQIDGSFMNHELNLLYIQLVAGQEAFTNEERIAINRFTPQLMELDKTDVDYQAKAKACFKKLFDITNPLLVTNSSGTGIADKEANNVKEWTESLSANEVFNGTLVRLLKNIPIKKRPLPCFVPRHHIKIFGW